MPWREGLDQKVCGLHQPLQQGAPVATGKIQGDTAFVGGIRPPEKTAFGLGLVVIERADSPRRAAPRWLHLDDVGPQVGEDFAAQDAAFVSQINNPIGAQQTCVI
jgi:hypothetical protein